MIKTLSHKNITWVDLESPTEEDARYIIEKYGVHPLVGNELLSPTARPRVDVYNDFIYLILHFPTVVHSHDGEPKQEIDFIIGKNVIITAHYEMVDALNEFSKLFEVGTILDKGNIGEHAGYLFFYMVRELYDRAADELESIREGFSDIEERIFAGEEKKMVREISIVSRKLIDFRDAVRPHREMLESFSVAGKKKYGNDFEYYLHAIVGEYYKIEVTLENSIAMLTELRITNDSLLTTKTNSTMKNLTIMAFITFPLMLFTSMFGMNTSYLPIVGNPNDFWIIIGIMTLATLGFYSFFRSKKWL